VTNLSLPSSSSNPSRASRPRGPTRPAAAVLALSGLALAASCATGREDRSGADAERVGAAPLAIDVIIDDVVDVEAGDGTDWRYVEIDKPGQLGVQLRWDDPRSQLGLTLVDALGKALAEGEIWENNGRQIVFNAEDPGRYYLRVTGPDRSKRTTYSLKVSYQRLPGRRCFDCVVGQTTCVGKDGYAVCEATKEGCNAWVQVLACPASQVCGEGGQCREGCENQCKPEERRCASNTAAQVCVKGPAGCYVWNEPILCDAGHACSGGRCRKAEAGARVAATGSKPAAEVAVKGEIKSAYVEGTSRMLHIRVGEGHSVTPGTRGQVLEGDSDKPLDGGDISVVSVSGAFVKAQTSLATVGNNRRVVFKVKP
jgi:hypothetical protein